MKKYGVVGRKPIVDRFTQALEAAQYRILAPPDPNSAPFELSVETPNGRHLDLVCYAFFANKYRQNNRPKDEHRFQIKYGSDFKTYHEIYIDKERQKLTLMFGVHLEHDIVVAVDPTMHNPTWFSKSIYFKDQQIAQIQETGWLAWHRRRQRFGGRRKQPAPQPTLADEVILGLVPENFGAYVEFEHLATGMNPKERLLLAQRFLETRPQIQKPRELSTFQACRGKASVFVSYSHADTNFVNALEQSLDRNFIQCWRDVKSLTAGPMEGQIKRGIESNPVVIVLSENSIKSDWVEFEATYARKQEKSHGRHVLCPVALDRSWQTAPWSSVLTNQIRKYNILDFSDWQDDSKYENQMKKLVTGLRDYYFER